MYDSFFASSCKYQSRSSITSRRFLIFLKILSYVYEIILDKICFLASVDGLIRVISQTSSAARHSVIISIKSAKSVSLSSKLTITESKILWKVMSEGEIVYHIADLSFITSFLFRVEELILSVL